MKLESDSQRNYANGKQLPKIQWIIAYNVIRIRHVLITDILYTIDIPYKDTLEEAEICSL